MECSNADGDAIGSPSLLQHAQDASRRNSAIGFMVTAEPLHHCTLVSGQRYRPCFETAS
jgi:hypothetical protein